MVEQACAAVQGFHGDRAVDALFSAQCCEQEHCNIAVWARLKEASKPRQYCQRLCAVHVAANDGSISLCLVCSLDEHGFLNAADVGARLETH